MASELVWQVDEAALLAVTPKHLLFTGSSYALRGPFSPSRAVLFDRYFTSQGGGCFYLPHVYINHSAQGGCLPDAFPWCSREAQGSLRVHLRASLEQFLLKCEIHCGTAFLKPGPNEKGLLFAKNLLYNMISSNTVEWHLNMFFIV